MNNPPLTSTNMVGRLEIRNEIVIIIKMITSVDSQLVIFKMALISSFLDAIASPNTFPGQSVSDWVGQ